MDWMALIAAVAMIVLGFGLFCLAVLLTLATLWPYLSLGIRLAVLRAWAQLSDYIGETGRKYFDRIKWFGHTKQSTKVAVICSLAMWFGVAVAFAFPAYWRVSVAVLLVLPALFFALGWYLGGRQAPAHSFRFTCSFFEPAIALAVPLLAGKLMDIGLQALKAAL
jgi:hypothetical protein